MLDKGLSSDQEAGSEHENDALGPSNDVFEVLPPVTQRPAFLRHYSYFPKASSDPGCALLCEGILGIIGDEIILIHGISFLRPCIVAMISLCYTQHITARTFPPLMFRMVPVQKLAVAR